MTELLAPAKDYECGAIAIDCGADAVYIGAARFGAREDAGNPLDDIARLAEYAHRYRAHVYATVNTLLRDDDIAPALALIRQLHQAGVDGLIIQDVGLLECDLPPLPLIASTQMHNVTPERVAFLERIGFNRAILARELSLDQIRAIRAAAPAIELEFFVHGSLCVCYSGQCSLSYALGGRSGNRGACAQPCRKAYSLLDARGEAVACDQHLLSLKDLNLSDHLGDLLGAGVTSFKIEGRLKDAAYVANVVAHYRARLDEAMAAAGYRKASSGRSEVGFTPDLSKTFNREYTTFFLTGSAAKVSRIQTPKMLGEPLGRVTALDRNSLTVDTASPLHAGDGLCWFDRDGHLQGTSVNAARGRIVTPANPEALRQLFKGTLVYRNHDHEFLTALKKARKERRIAVALTLRSGPRGLTLEALDEDGVRAEFIHASGFAPAAKPEQAVENLKRQLARTGGTGCECTAVTIAADPVPFLPMGEINALRRGVLEALAAAREAQRPRPRGGVIQNDVPFPEQELTYLGNVLNKKAEAFYRRHGVTRIEPAAESGLAMRGRKVMTTRYCLKREMGYCARFGGANAGKDGLAEPLVLLDGDGNRLALRFNCARCEMEVHLES